VTTKYPLHADSKTLAVSDHIIRDMPAPDEARKLGEPRPEISWRALIDMARGGSGQLAAAMFGDCFRRITV
jgi:hypothetical protein